jgi:hypothetical protein
MSSSVALYEVLFTVPAAVGFLVCWWAFNDSVADLHYLQARGLNGAREVVARASCRNEAVRAFIQCMFLLLGLYLMTVEPANAEQPRTAQGLAVSLVIITAEVLMVVKSVMDRRDRHAVIRILAARKDTTA